MAKDKKGSKAAAAPTKTTASKPLESVKDGRVGKAADKAKNVAKETAKKTAKAIEKKSKKVREPTPESESESEDADTSDSSASSDDESDEESEVESHPKINGTAKTTAQESDEEEDEDDSSEESDSDEEPAPKKSGSGKVNGIVNGKTVAKPADDSSDASSEEDEEDDEDESSYDDEAERPKVNGAAKAELDDDDEDQDDSDSDDESGSSDSSDDDEEEEEVVPKAQDNKKRKAEAQPEQTPKKAKTDESTGIANLFVGNLSWNVDEEWLTREFETYGELKGVRIITNYDTGRSKGFGYVEFVDAADAAKAQAEKHESELDGRALNVDFSAPRGARSEGGTPQQKSFDRAKKFGDKVNEPSSTLFVGNISFDADESTVTETFQEYGSIKAVRLPTDRETGQPKGFGYVEMSSVDEAKAALEALQGADVAGRPIRLDYAGARPNNDSPGGRGGFGGRGRGGFGDRGGRGRGGFGDRGGRGGRGGGRGGSTNRGGFGDFSGRKTTF